MMTKGGDCVSRKPSCFHRLVFAAGSISPSQAIDDSKKKASLLRDSSWIKRPEEENEPVE